MGLSSTLEFSSCMGFCVAFFFVGGWEGGFGVSFGVHLRDGCCCYCCRRLLLLSLVSSKPIHNVRTPLGIWVVTRIMAYCWGIVIYNQINSMCCYGLYNIVFQKSINKFQNFEIGLFFKKNLNLKFKKKSSWGWGV
jgi:hypothetical protein